MKNKILLNLFCALFLWSCSTSNNSIFLVGTYTDNASQGINFINFNNKTKELSQVSIISEIENPSFVITNKSKSIIVAVEETESDKGGKITSFWYNSETKTFQKINSFFTKGNHPCTLAFSDNEDYVLVGNYSGGNLAVFPIDKTGKLSENSQFIQYEGKSENAKRQEKPHVHSIIFHPKEKVIFVADLGSDDIKMIPFNENSKSFLQPENTVLTKVAAGSGPRHLVFNKAGNLLFATLELTNEVAVFEYKNNKLNHLQTIALTNTSTKNGSAAELRLSNDEKFLYASVRGEDNQLVVIKVDGFHLKKIQSIQTKLKPRNFILTKNQKNILVATQNSNLISVFERDTKTGLLSATSNELTINKPVYLFAF